EDGIRDFHVTGVQTCALPISACMITLSKPNLRASAFRWSKCSSCSKVSTDPQINGWPNLFPKSEAPLLAFIKMSIGVWYSHLRSGNAFSHGRFSSNLEYDVIYTAVPASGNEPFPPANLSLISPPEPVAAPLKGSTVVGKLCVSAFNDITDSTSLVS